MPQHTQPDASLHRPLSLNLTPLAHAARLTLYGVLLLGGASLVPAMAQGAATAVQSDAVRQYNIPAGTLDQVLGNFGRTAGVMIAIDPALTSGLRSAGLQGTQLSLIHI